MKKSAQAIMFLSMKTHLTIMCKIKYLYTPVLQKKNKIYYDKKNI